MEEDIQPFIFKEDYAVINPEYNKLLLQDKFKQAQIPNEYLNLNWNDYVGENSKETIDKLKIFAQKINKENSINLYLWSIKPSSQKTAVATYILKTYIEKGFLCKFVPATKIINAMLKVQGYSDDEEANQFLSGLDNCDVIVIDDAYNALTSLEFKTSKLIVCAWDEFLRQKIRDGIQIIITSNNSVQYILDKFGENLYDLVERNFIKFELKDVVKNKRKEDLKNKFEEIIKE